MAGVLPGERCCEPFRYDILYIMSDIAELLTSARESAGLTQAELARRAGTSQSAIARLERGQVSPSLETVRRLARAAGFEVRVSLVPRTDGDPVVEAYKRDVDRTLLRDNLRKTVDRRLRDIDAFRRDADELRSAVASRRARR
jgi:transcriptional regulator with XRE-family HTH domain